MAPISELKAGALDTNQSLAEAEGCKEEHSKVAGGKVRKRKSPGGICELNDSRNGRKRHAGSLPTCQVCFNQGSGFHYGADTCEPCKTFFRRNVALQETLECRKSDNSCKPAPGKKFKCAACRLTRCFDIGMSIEGIKLGRYTDVKRLQNRAIEISENLLQPDIALGMKQNDTIDATPFIMTPPTTPKTIREFKAIQNYDSDTLENFSLSPNHLININKNGQEKAFEKAKQHVSTIMYSPVTDMPLNMDEQYQKNVQFENITDASRPITDATLLQSRPYTFNDSNSGQPKHDYYSTIQSIENVTKSSPDTQSFVHIDTYPQPTLPKNCTISQQQLSPVSNQHNSLNEMGSPQEDSFLNSLLFDDPVQSNTYSMPSGDIIEQKDLNPEVLSTEPKLMVPKRTKTSMNHKPRNLSEYEARAEIPSSESFRRKSPALLANLTDLQIPSMAPSALTQRKDSDIQFPSNCVRPSSNFPTYFPTLPQYSETNSQRSTDVSEVTVPEQIRSYNLPASSVSRECLPVLDNNRFQFDGNHTPYQMTPNMSVPPMITGTSNVLLDTFIDHVTNLYSIYDAHCPEFFQKIHKYYFEYLETQSLKRKMFGSLRSMPLPEYRKILIETGLDVDGRLQRLTHRQLPSYENSYFLYLNFVQGVPGFKDLPMEDQDVLIKGARIDYWMLSEYNCFNVEMELHVLPEGFVMAMEDKLEIFGKPFVKGIFTAAGKFQKLGLTEDERNLLKCIYLFSRSANCSTPEGRITTQKHFEFFKQVLHYLREREGRIDRAAYLDSRLEPLMNELGELEERDWDEFFALWKDFPMIRFPPVTKSFYFGSPTSDNSIVHKTVI